MMRMIKCVSVSVQSSVTHINHIILALRPHTILSPSRIVYHTMLHGLLVGGLLQLYPYITMCPTVTAYNDTVLAAARVAS